jgi:hypothetical protein
MANKIEAGLLVVGRRFYVNGPPVVKKSLGEVNKPRTPVV